VIAPALIEQLWQHAACAFSAMMLLRKTDNSSKKTPPGSEPAVLS